MDYHLILERNFSNVEWSLNANDYDQLTWLSDSKKPTKAQLEALWETTLASIEAEKEAVATKRQALLEKLGITEEEAKILLS